jgi:hypothetical protein
MKFPIERIVGGTSEQKKQAKEILLEEFEEQKPEGLSEIEVPKTPEVRECINIANKVTSEILRRYGIEKEDIDEDKIHLVKKEAWPEHLSETGAFFKLYNHSIVAPEGLPKIKLTWRLIHEIFHFKSYLAAQVLSNGFINDYRIGLTVNTRDGVQTQLIQLNEAITEELTREATQTQFFKEVFAYDLESIERIMKEHSDAENEDGKPLFTDQTFYVEVGEKSADGSFPISTSQFTYQTERKGLQLLINKLFEANRDAFSNSQEVYALLVKGSFTGDLLKIGRLIETSFGVGTFRKLANPESSDEFLKIIEDLK